MSPSEISPTSIVINKDPVEVQGRSAALDAHTSMSTQALESESVRERLKGILLGPAQLYEALQASA